MSQSDIAFWLAVILAALRIYEFATAARPRFKVTPNLTGSPNVGSTIVVENASGTPANIGYFDLAWVNQKSLFGWAIPFTRKVVLEDSLDDPPYDPVTIPAHSTYTLLFADEHHFGWGSDLEQDIYLRLWLIGRNRPIWIWITGPLKS